MYDSPAPISVMSAEAVQEQLGDLKLYRIPRRTTVAAMQMKQSRLLERSAVGIELYYTSGIYIRNAYGPWFEPTRAMLRTRNDKQHALGLPLPAGVFLIDQFQFGRPMVLAEPALRDTAMDEKIELEIGTVSDVTIEHRCLKDEHPKYTMRTTISNAGATPIQFELTIENDVNMKVIDSTVPVIERDGVRMMVVTVPAESSVVLTYTGTGQDS